MESAMVPVDTPTKLPSDGGREGSVRWGLCAAIPRTTLVVFAAALCVRGRSYRCIVQHDEVMRPVSALLGPFPGCLGGLGGDSDAVSKRILCGNGVRGEHTARFGRGGGARRCRDGGHALDPKLFRRAGPHQRPPRAAGRWFGATLPNWLFASNLSFSTIVDP